MFPPKLIHIFIIFNDWNFTRQQDTLENSLKAVGKNKQLNCLVVYCPDLLHSKIYKKDQTLYNYHLKKSISFKTLCDEVRSQRGCTRPPQLTGYKDVSLSSDQIGTTLLLLVTYFPGGRRMIEEEFAEGSRHVSRDDRALTKKPLSSGRIG